MAYFAVFRSPSEVSSDQSIREDVNSKRNKRDIECEDRRMMLKEVHSSLKEGMGSTGSQAGREQTWSSNTCLLAWLLEELWEIHGGGPTEGSRGQETE